MACDGSSSGNTDNPHAMPSVWAVILFCSFHGLNVMALSSTTIPVSVLSSRDVSSLKVVGMISSCKICSRNMQLMSQTRQLTDLG